MIDHATTSVQMTVGALLDKYSSNSSSSGSSDNVSLRTGSAEQADARHCDKCTFGRVALSQWQSRKC